MPVITYEKAVADILHISATGDDPDTQAYVAAMCKVYSEFLVTWAERTSGYMLMTAFVVSFTEIKKVAQHAQGKDKTLIEELIKAIIGSFGSTVQ